MKVEKRKLPQRSLPRGLAGRITLWFMQKEHKSVYKNMVKVLDLQPEDDLLEVACGSGHFLKKYASGAHSVAGLELSEVAGECYDTRQDNSNSSYFYCPFCADSVIVDNSFGNRSSS